MPNTQINNSRNTNMPYDTNNQQTPNIRYLYTAVVLLAIAIGVSLFYIGSTLNRQLDETKKQQANVAAEFERQQHVYQHGQQPIEWQQVGRQLDGIGGISSPSN